MALFRIVMPVLAVLHVIFVALTATAGAFADGGSIGERLLLVMVHLLSAVGLLVMVFARSLPVTLLRVVVALLIVNVAATLISDGALRGGARNSSSTGGRLSVGAFLR